MEALRIVTKPENGRIVIDMPEGLKEEKKVEVIILPFEEHVKRRTRFDPTKYRGIWKDSDIDVEKICREMREEWEWAI